MSTDLLAPLARLISTAEAIEGLRDLFAAEEPLDDIAARVAETALAAIPYADAVSITALSWPDARTAASTHERALELDHHQYASGRGPCLEAAWQRAPVRAAISEEHQRWPEFVEAAQRVGIHASLSVPLLIGGIDEKQELLGSLNIYSQTASAFDPFDAQLMRLYTAAAGQAISNAGRWQDSRETVTQLERRSSPVQTSTWLKELSSRYTAATRVGPSPDWWTNLNGETSKCATSLSRCSTGCKHLLRNPPLEGLLDSRSALGSDCA